MSLLQSGTSNGRRPGSTSASLQEGGPVRGLARQPQDGSLGEDKDRNGRKSPQGKARAVQVIQRRL